MRRRSWLGFAPIVFLVALPVSADVPPQRSVTRLPSANGHGAVMLDLAASRITHFREHLFANEEPLLDAQGKEVWTGNQPQHVASRDLLFDAYFGLRSGGQQAWLTGAKVDADASGYAPWMTGKAGGTGIATMVQTVSPLTIAQHVFAPRALGQNGFVMLAHVTNGGTSTVTGVSLFSIHNFHLGFGRPGVMQDIGAEGETITYDPVKGDFLERAFAGVIAARPLGTTTHHFAWSSLTAAADTGFAIVAAGGATDLPDVSGQQPTGDDSASAFQLDVGDLAAGADAWVGVVFAHHGDPFGDETAQSWLDTYVAGRGAKALFDAEIAEWSAFQTSLTVPSGLTDGEESMFRQSAAMLRMGQVEETESFLRESLTKDGEPRYTHFGTTPGGAPATLPATIAHHGKGAVLASLPPGEWTVTWSRDTAYSIAAMSAAGMKNEAKAALEFYLGAEAGKFQTWMELTPYAMPPYQVSLVRYHGFGIEETDVNDFGPNLEFDGFGLFLWALGRYETLTGDTSVSDGAWMTAIGPKVGDVILALIDPATGLVKPDSSIWETHWNGRQRAFAYTSITAARGLCDAAAIATRIGDTARAKSYRDAALALRAAIASHLTDPSHALVSNAEELASGDGYWDAAVLDGIALGLFDPKGAIAKATLTGLDAHLKSTAGAGWSRNDDDKDHPSGTDLSPWGSDYDSAEWVFLDLRGAIATHLGGDEARATELVKWVTDQSVLNYLEASETYDQTTGAYKFNSPMVGFGAGAYVLALAARTASPDPACGAYFDESTGAGGASGAGGGASGGMSGAGGGGAPAGVGGSHTNAGTGGVATTGGSGGAAAGHSGNAGSAGTSAAGATMSATGVGGSKGVAGTTTYDAPVPDDSAGNGCSCDVAGRESPLSFAGLLASIAALVARRSRRRD